jgi:hypothetical protein
VSGKKYWNLKRYQTKNSELRFKNCLVLVVDDCTKYAMLHKKTNSRAAVRDDVRMGPGAKAEAAVAIASTMDARSIAMFESE